MLHTYRLNGAEIDSLELKVLLITSGVNVGPEVYKAGSVHPNCGRFSGEA